MISTAAQLDPGCARRGVPRGRPVRRLFLAIPLTLAACRTVPTPPPAGAASGGRGTVGFSFLEGVPPTLPVLDSNQEFRPAYADPANPLPSYPEDLERLDLPRQEVVVRVIIGADGSVERIGEAPVPSQVDPSSATRFVAAVERAVRSWSFEPAFVRTYGPGPDDDADGVSDYLVLATSETLVSYHDLCFVFEFEEGRGVVSGR
ncbi:MAG: hypothetical protein R2862_12045 [Thermoanaerobaculia bacterium]